MKYEIIKGSEKDFEGCHDDITSIYLTPSSGKFYATKYSAIVNSWHLIAERRPITEPANEYIDWQPCGVSFPSGVYGKTLVDVILTGGQAKASVTADSLEWFHSLHPSDSVKKYRISAINSWSGEGLPPVGCICEWIPFSDDVRVVQIIAYHDGAAWLERRDKFSGIGELVANPDNFRPLRSPADMAREKITLDMLKYMYSSDETDYAQVCKIYEAIAAGKIPGVKLEVQSGD